MNDIQQAQVDALKNEILRRGILRLQTEGKEINEANVEAACKIELDLFTKDYLARQGTVTKKKRHEKQVADPREDPSGARWHPNPISGSKIKAINEKDQKHGKESDGR